MSGKFWKGSYRSGSADAVYSGGKVWRGSYPSGSADAVYKNGKIWNGSYPSGSADAVYENGKIWNGSYSLKMPIVFLDLCQRRSVVRSGVQESHDGLPNLPVVTHDHGNGRS